ncbi:hypothetical protein AB0F81_44340 [Actinoplanes sp. NPDC024001]|uniref:hypothetical protein n=1 Tax=Actinoplanes sp. NPDC024001 TaxID=3154598 RepID=UPI0033C84C00
MLSRVPAALLITTMCLLGVCAVPSASFFLVAAVSSGSFPAPVMLFVVPVLLAYPIGLWLWLRARRQRSAGRAWLHAALGILLVAGASFPPVAVFGAAFVEEWEETQPGGRGYRP